MPIYINPIAPWENTEFNIRDYGETTVLHTHNFYHANIDILDFIYKRYNTSSFRFDYIDLQGLSFNDHSRTILRS